MEATTETSVKTHKTVSSDKILEAFNSSVDVNNSYTLDELKKILSLAYKNAGKKSKGGTTEKREPNKYNLFVKDEMIRLKALHPEKPNKEIMSMAAALWKESKATIEPTV
jgi:hypothetical protein